VIKVAVAQIFCIDGDKEGNFVRIEHALSKAGRVDIACFPETCLLGWVNPDAHRLADPIPGDSTDRLCDLAKRYDVMLCVGLAEKDGDRNGPRRHDNTWSVDGIYIRLPKRRGRFKREDTGRRSR